LQTRWSAICASGSTGLPPDKQTYQLVMPG